MRFWVQKSEKEAGTAYVGAEHKGVTAFGALHIGARELAHTASAVGAALLLRRLNGRQRGARWAQKDALRRQKKTSRTLGRQKAPRRGEFGGKRGGR